MDITLAMGVERLGGHWDAFSVEVLGDEGRARQAWARLVKTFRSLAVLARQKGLTALYDEQMYIPSEKPWTLAETERFLLEVNRKNRGVPVRPTLDVGHAAGLHYGASGPDIDYREWLRRFAAVSEIIHLHQTPPEASCHWPFTWRYNRRGHIRIPEVLEAVRLSHQEFPSSPLCEVLKPVNQTWLIVEYLPGSIITEKQVLLEIAQTAEYLHQFVPPEGMEIAV